MKETSRFPNGFLLLYASQKGNAKAIAEDLAEQCESKGLINELRCCSEIGKTFSLEETRCLVLVGSTTGDGEPPDTARKFWRQLHKKGQPSNVLGHLSYTILGLGDTNYTNFCNFGKTIDQKLQDLGGKRFYPCGWADDGTGLEIVVEPWIEGLFPALQKHFDKMAELVDACNQVAFVDNSSTIEQVNTNKKGVNKDPICDDPSHSQNVLSSTSQNSSDNILKGDIVSEDTYTRIAKKYNLDFLSRDELQCLPVRSCTLPVDAKLTLPVLPSDYLMIKYLENSEKESGSEHVPALPSVASELIKTSVTSIRKLTQHNSVKTALEVSLTVPESINSFDYEPGDSFGIIVQNREEEVELFLSLLGISDVAEKTYELSVDPNTKKKGAAIPKYIPVRSSLHYVFQSCVDIRSVPKKPLLRILVQYTSDPTEKRRLQELVSKECASEYVKCVREQGLTLLDLLCIFQTCKPPVTTLLEHLPQLLPRAYSITSSPLVDSKKISFVFNVVDIPKEKATTFSRKGICTGWLASLYKTVEMSKLEESLEVLSIKDKGPVYVPIYLRTNQNFRLSGDVSSPIIMIGPGTGVAPFVGFLQHKHKLQIDSPDISFGESWLFYGCRHKERDYLYREELEKFRDSKILSNLIVSFSRDDSPPGSPRYVQDNIIKYGVEMASLITDKAAIVYVCGDARNMSKGVFDTFVSILKQHRGLTEIEARRFMAQMQLEKRYLQDVWS
ncbi:methionine synthase reductase-like isoform X2 [Penaeus chinensis]|uniref:methionine synthase reductase-like isoform X2 n=1 Tax=Penaeus chinensis TaxID=139456 RepID=UPI001FB74DED|nr:methionine synthase reductase-like isoform X2 [Penaeus chinensis]